MYEERSHLVLSRRCGESVLIGADVLITIHEVRGDRVRIGVTAPRDVPIYRNEVLEAMREGLRPPPSGAPPTDEKE